MKKLLVLQADKIFITKEERKETIYDVARGVIISAPLNINIIEAYIYPDDKTNLMSLLNSDYHQDNQCAQKLKEQLQQFDRTHNIDALKQKIKEAFPCFHSVAFHKQTYEWIELCTFDNLLELKIYYTDPPEWTELVTLIYKTAIKNIEDKQSTMESIERSINKLNRIIADYEKLENK